MRTPLFLALVLLAAGASAAPSLEKCAYLVRQNGMFGLDSECTDVLSRARDSGELKRRGGVNALAQAYKPEEDGPKIEDQAAIDAMAKTLGAQVRPSARCTSVGRCFDVCKDGQFYGQATLVSGGLVDDLKTKVQSNLGGRATGPCPSKDDKPDLEAAKKACPAPDPNRSPRDLADLIAKKKERSPETGNLGAVDFLMVCASHDTGKDLASLGLTRDKAQALMELAKPKDIKAPDAALTFDKAFADVFRPGGPATARMAEYFKQHPDKQQAFMQAYSRCEKLPDEQAGDCRGSLTNGLFTTQARWGGHTEADRYEGALQKIYGKDTASADALRSLIKRQNDPKMQAHFEEWLKKCKNGDEAACASVRSNYAGVLQGRPRTSLGRDYLNRACSSLDAEQNTYARVADQQLQATCLKFRQKPSGVPSPAVTQRRAAPRAAKQPARPVSAHIGDAISSVLSPIFGSAQPRRSRYYDLRTKQDCWNPDRNPDCVPRP